MSADMSVRALIQAVDQTNSGFASATRNLDAFERGFETRIARMRKTGEVASTIGTTLGAIGAAGTAAMVPMVKESMQLDQALRNVNSIAKQGEKGFQDFGEAVKKIARDPLVTDMPTTLAGGLYQIYSSGLAGQEALDALAVSAKGAMAGMSDTATAATVLVAAMNAYGQKTGRDAQHFMDVFFKTVEQGVITFPELASGMGNVIGMAAQLKVPIETVAAATATMTRMGVGADETFVSLARILSTLLSPSKEYAEAIQAAGYESGLAMLHAKGLAGVMEFLTQVTGGSQDKMAQMLGEIRAVRGAFALTGEGAKVFQDQLVQMSEASGSAAIAATEQMKGAANQWKKLMQDISLSSDATGKVLWNTFGPVLTLLTEVIGGVNRLAEMRGGKYIVGGAGVATVGAGVAGGGLAAYGMLARAGMSVAESAGAASWIGRAATSIPKAGVYTTLAAGTLALGAGVYEHYRRKGERAPGMAGGGHIGPAGVAWVGEQGPELAVARGGGVDIIPMHRIPGFQGGGRVVWPRGTSPPLGPGASIPSDQFVGQPPPRGGLPPRGSIGAPERIPYPTETPIGVGPNVSWGTRARVAGGRFMSGAGLAYGAYEEYQAQSRGRSTGALGFGGAALTGVGAFKGPWGAVAGAGIWMGAGAAGALIGEPAQAREREAEVRRYQSYIIQLSPWQRRQFVAMNADEQAAVMSGKGMPLAWVSQDTRGRNSMGMGGTARARMAGATPGATLPVGFRDITRDQSYLQMGRDSGYQFTPQAVMGGQAPHMPHGTTGGALAGGPGQMGGVAFNPELWGAGGGGLGGVFGRPSLASDEAPAAASPQFTGDRELSYGEMMGQGEKQWMAELVVSGRRGRPDAETVAKNKAAREEVARLGLPEGMEPASRRRRPAASGGFQYATASNVQDVMAAMQALSSQQRWGVAARTGETSQLNRDDYEYMRDNARRPPGMQGLTIGGGGGTAMPMPSSPIIVEIRLARGLVAREIGTPEGTQAVLRIVGKHEGKTLPQGTEF